MTKPCPPNKLNKRLIDLFLASLGLFLLLPLLLLLVILIRFLLGSPVIFLQKRPGLHGQLFTIIKFRTMVDRRDMQGKLLPDAERMTRFGSFLRSSSLDELPELINVLRGEMSLVGPRPLMVEYLPRYNADQARRHLVLPGITGWAQVNGRNEISWEEKFRLDVWYVDHQSLSLDFKILFMTLLKVVRRDGISAQGHATMPCFKIEREEREVH